MRIVWAILVSLGVGVLSSGCDSGSDRDNDSDESTPPTRGMLIDDPPPRVASLSFADLALALGQDFEGQQFLQFAGTPACRVDVHQLHYHTLGGSQEPTTASGALMVPTGTDPQCQGERPVVLYAHGTSSDREFDIADVNSGDSLEGLLLAAAFAAQGYIVVAPNYAGYHLSALDYHPYLNAEQSAHDMIDALAAARSALPTAEAPTTEDGAQLFITGYSQGGHAAMAAHRALEGAGNQVTASAPMSGPYALSAFGDAVFFGQVNAGAPLFLTLLITGYERSYGNVYASPSDAFAQPYADGIESLLPSTVPRSELLDSGQLPRDQLFSDTAPAAEFEVYTPAIEPDRFAAVFARGFGPEHLLTNEFRLAYLQDAEAHPDGGFPTTTDGLPPAAPAHGLRQAFKMNDLRDWTPAAPVLLCGGNGDPTVYYLNTQLMQGYWAQSEAPVTVLDVDGETTESDPNEALKDGFDAAKLLVAANAVADGATDGGEMAVSEQYHAGLVAPFCLIAAYEFFETLQ